MTETCNLAATLPLAQIQAAAKCFPRAELQFIHKFLGPLYFRVMIAPPETFIMGAEHKMKSFFFVLRGNVRVWDASSGVRELSAGFCERNYPGQQKLGYTRGGVICANLFCSGFERDITTLENRLADWTRCTGLIDLETGKLLKG